LRKGDFAAGLEKMKVLLSRQDSDKVFNFLDKIGNGHLTFNQFCSIVEETQSRNVDAYKI
jgi:Ca2+-binding EF-hand superfamily protein